ncbi:MAG: DNA repair protein RadA [Candidatus Cloacimonetes bacterium]|nr:DNA repair protein RadA [Candidatus Cloacimonadota bacterium]
MFVCKECGFESQRWTGKCPGCGSWNSFIETSRIIGKKHKKSRTIPEDDSVPVFLKEIPLEDIARLTTDVKEFDGVLGGGIVPGMVVLIGGEPGIGKSTLLLQISDKVSLKDKKVLYVSGEESKEQIRMRAHRLQISSGSLLLLCSNDTGKIIDYINESDPDLVIIDSIQSIYLSGNDSVPGSVSQLRECTGLITKVAKQKNIPVFLIGHVTKDGIVAGPKIIEHMVDTVLYFEGEVRGQFKILRAIKNRFGSTNEIGIFEMVSAGLREVDNPSQLFVNVDEEASGCAVGCIIEGSRAFLVEVQALVSDANFGTSQRVAVGFVHKKLAILIAIIEKNLDIQLRQSDVFINLTGGIQSDDTSLDLTTICAIISSYTDRTIAPKTLVMGEVGLNGEIRPVSYAENRVKEAIRLGYQNIILSEKNKVTGKKANLIRISHLSELLKKLL